MESGGRVSEGDARRADAKPASSAALLRFRHTAGGSGVSRMGHIRPGGALVVEYDPARLPVRIDTAGTASEVVCHVRFSPGGKVLHAPMQGLAAAGGPPALTRLAPFEVLVPEDAASVELWFESRRPDGTTSWDSRYGANYTFGVVEEGLPIPEPSVALRLTATVDPSRIRVVKDAATKETAVMGTAGERVQTGLVIRALVTDLTGVVDAWADVHVFDGSDELVDSGSVVLERRGSTPDGELFVLEDVIYQGSGGGSWFGVGCVVPTGRPHRPVSAILPGAAAGVRKSTRIHRQCPARVRTARRSRCRWHLSRGLPRLDRGT